MNVEAVKLTQLTASGGCAAKYSAARLADLLAGLVLPDREDVLVGLDPPDDAAVYRLDEERALIFTLDFFPPIVDDPRHYGAIAATNALNDVFAMGGTPLLALSIAAFPEELSTKDVRALLVGAEETVRTAGALLVGGHTVRDAEPKYGLAVLGTVHPRAVWRKDGAKPGDGLFLTKPLGTGLVVNAHAHGNLRDEDLECAIAWMTALNGSAADALRPFAPNAVTDVTGFGLFGHAHEVAERSGVRFRLDSRRMPAMRGALEAARHGVRTGADARNREFAARHVKLDGVSDELAALGYDAQTAGGLLVSLPAERGLVLEAAFAARGLFIRRIGSVEHGSAVLVE